MRQTWILTVLGTAFFVVILDSTIVFVALPSIQRDLGFSEAGLQWVVSAYLVTFGGLLLFGGRLADLCGRRRILLIGIAVFTIASLLCGVATSPAALIGSRALQGVGGAILAPTALSLLLATFERGPERNRALGIWGGIGGVGGTAGLLLGGPITGALGWSWIFFVNVPVGAALLVAGRLLLRESRATERPPGFDVAGAATVTAALILLVLGVTQTSWPALAAAGVLGAIFMLIERRSSAPLLPERVVRSHRLVAGNALLIVAGVCVDGTLLVLTLHGQNELGRSPVEFGLVAAVMTGASVAGSFAGQAVVTRRGVRPVAMTGLALLAGGSLLLARAPGSDLVGLPVFGAGLGAAFVSAQIAAVASAPEGDTGLVAGIADTSFTIGGLLGVAVMATIPATRSALLLGAGVAVVGLVLAATLLGTPRRRRAAAH